MSYNQYFNLGTLDSSLPKYFSDDVLGYFYINNNILDVYYFSLDAPGHLNISLNYGSDLTSSVGASLREDLGTKKDYDTFEDPIIRTFLAPNSLDFDLQSGDYILDVSTFSTDFIFQDYEGVLTLTEVGNEISRGSTVYRFFNASAGVHFYTPSETEKDYVDDNLENYTYEGESYVTVDHLTGNSAEAVYRFFNYTTGVHLYTTSEVERDYISENLSNFAYEDITFYAYETEQVGTIPIYRFYEPTIGVHFYTPNEEEKIFVEENLSNYNYEGIAYYAFPISDTDSI